MTEQEVRHVSDRYQQPHGGKKEFAGRGRFTCTRRIPIGRSWCGPEIWCI
ncbi:MAG: hypothetical protein ACLU38_01300 [Dysosmobacter sp.]